MTNTQAELLRLNVSDVLALQANASGQHMVQITGDASPQALLALKQSMRQRLQSSPAWNVDQYTRDLESALVALTRAPGV